MIHSLTSALAVPHHNHQLPSFRRGLLGQK